MKRNLAFTAALFALVSYATAQNTATTDPVGFVSVTVPAQSDAVLAVPLNRTAAFKGKIQTISGSTITVAGTPAWTADQFVQAIPTQNDTFAIQIATGTKEGLIAKVTANTTNTLTVQVDAGDDLTGVKSVDVDGILNADEIDVLPYWTPASLFTTPPSTGVRILLFPTNVGGINLASSQTIVRGPSSWLVGPTNSDHVPLSFGQSFVLRNQTATIQNISLVGSVPMVSHRYLLGKVSAVGVAQDIRVGYSSPVPEFVGNLALGFSPGDRLLVFDNTVTGLNKSASVTLVYNGSAWLQGATDVSATFQLIPGQGYIFRRSPAAPVGTVLWSDTQSYLQ